MINNRKYTNNEDSDDYIFEDEQEFEEQLDEQTEAPDIEEIAVTLDEGEGAEGSAEPAPTEQPEQKTQEDYAELYGEGEPPKPGKRKRIIIIAAAVALIAAALLASGIIIHKFTPSKARVDYNEYFGVEGNEAILIYNYGKSDYKVKLSDGGFYVENSFLKENFTDKFFYDEKNNEVLYTTATGIYTFPIGEKNYDADGESRQAERPVAIKDNGTVYISVDFASERCDMVWRGYENPDRLVIVDGGSEYMKTILNDEYVVRESASIKGTIIEDTSDGADTMWMLADGDVNASQGQEWFKVFSEDGRGGYVRSAHTTGAAVPYTYDSGYEKEEYPAQTRNHDILLVWHAVYDINDNGKIEELLADSKGVNTVSPTWYKAVDANGNISSMADRDYVEYIHGLGMEIWPLISDFTSVDGDGWDEKALLCNTASRRRLIQNIMAEINDYGYDGINIDFEKVSQDAGDGYIQFIRELSISCRKAGVVLSVDNYVPKPYNMQYNRSGQGECVDYVIVMGYDEHYAGGSEAGSVASISFVNEGISETLKEVPREKLINAVPFYTRMWIEGADEAGNISLSSKSYGMNGGAEAADELGLKKIWDDEVKQYVAAGASDGKSYSIWLEDERSMGERMKLIRSYNLAGVAAWCLGLEADYVWDIITGD